MITFERIYETFHKRKWEKFKKDPNKKEIKDGLPQLPKKVMDWAIEYEEMGRIAEPDDFERFTGPPHKNQKVPLSKVYSTTGEQEYDVGRFEKLYNAIEQDPKSQIQIWKTPINFLKSNGDYFFSDGHHRIAACLAAGKDYVNGTVYDMKDYEDDE
jgi:hypothetical protein